MLLLHGLADREIVPSHSQRIYDGLLGARNLVLLPGTGHNDVLGREEAWREIDAWLLGLPALQ